MAYSFCDVSKKTVGDGPCINGLRELKAFVKEQGPDKYPAMGKLLEYGYTNKLTQLIIDCRNLAKRAKAEKDIQSTVLAIGKAANKAEEIIIMEDA